MKVYSVSGCPGEYAVKSASDWYGLCAWMVDNDIGYYQIINTTDERGAFSGVRFSVRENDDWFRLRWL